MGFKISDGNPHRCSANTKPGGASPGDFFLIRHGSGLSQNFMDGTLKIEELTRGADCGAALDAVVLTAKPGVSCWEGKISDADKWYFMLEGSLEIIVGDVPQTLAEGDSLYLGSSDSHIWRNRGKGMAKALVLSTASNMKPGRAETVF